MADRKFKDPDAILDYPFDWGAEWMEAGDTIVSSSFTVPTGLTLELSSFTDTATVVWLSGGELGQRYLVTNHIRTAAGREDDWSILVEMKNR